MSEEAEQLYLSGPDPPTYLSHPRAGPPGAWRCPAGRTAARPPRPSTSSTCPSCGRSPPAPPSAARWNRSPTPSPAGPHRHRQCSGCTSVTHLPTAIRLHDCAELKSGVGGGVCVCGGGGGGGGGSFHCGACIMPLPSKSVSLPKGAPRGCISIPFSNKEITMCLLAGLLGSGLL